MEFGCLSSNVGFQDRGSSRLCCADRSWAFSWEDACFSPQMCKSGKWAGLTQCRHCHARGEIPALSTPVFRMSGCQLSSVAVPRERFGHSWSPVPVTEAGLCSRAISWQIVPGVPCADVFVTACQPGEIILRARGCRWPPVGSVGWEGAAQSPAEGAPGCGLGCSACAGRAQQGGHDSGL